MIKLFLTPQESDAIYIRKKINIFHVPFHRVGGMREDLKKKNKPQTPPPSQETTKELIRLCQFLGTVKAVTPRQVADGSHFERGQI